MSVLMPGNAARRIDTGAQPSITWTASDETTSYLVTSWQPKDAPTKPKEALHQAAVELALDCKGEVVEDHAVAGDSGDALESVGESDHRWQVLGMHVQHATA